MVANGCYAERGAVVATPDNVGMTELLQDALFRKLHNVDVQAGWEFVIPINRVALMASRSESIAHAFGAAE